MRSARVDRVVGDVTFIFQNARDLSLDFRVRNQHLRILCARAVADTRQKIGNRINSAHENQAACAAGPPPDGLAVANFLARSLNGIPISLNSDLASSSVRAVVTIVTSNPTLRFILSSSISGKIDWSETPIV